MPDDIFAPLGIDPASVVRTERIEGGIGDGSLLRVTLAHTMPGGGTRWHERRVIKRLTPRRGWLGMASDDARMRELTLWESRLLARLPLVATTSVLAWARDNAAGSGALLMSDLGARLIGDPYVTPRGYLPPPMWRILDALARIHARAWNDPCLADTSLGLTPPREALLLIAPATIAARLRAGDTNWYLPRAARGWEAFFATIPPDHAAAFQAIFSGPERLIQALAALPHTLVHGDVWGPNLGALPSTQATPHLGRRTVFLDWALATSGPGTYDPLWLCCGWPELDPTRTLAVYRTRLARHLRSRGVQLGAATWLALADAGYLRTVLTCGEALGQLVTNARGRSARLTAETRVRWWVERAVRGATRLAVVPTH